MLPSRSGILAEAINTKILKKSHPDYPHSHPNTPHSHPDFPHFYRHSRIPTLILCIATLIPRGNKHIWLHMWFLVKIFEIYRINLLS